MKFLLAPDSFKESMTAKTACLAMEKGIRQVFPDAECIMVPMADGGEGTVESLVDYIGGRIVQTEVTGPLGAKIRAEYALSSDGRMAIIEMASASGIHLVPKEQRNPLYTTTFGTGELIKHALDQGAKKILMGIGGSATNDGGAGMLQALGVSLQDRDGRELPYGGGALRRLETINFANLDHRLTEVVVEAACDVSNPLTGPKGASAVFGPQKGATQEMVEELEMSLSRFAEVMEMQLGIRIADVEGAGAAGGLGAGLMAFLKAELKKGTDVVVHYTDLERKMAEADYVFTGEGSIDSQTQFGKTPYGVASVARKHGIPVIAFAGKVGEGAESLYPSGFTAIIGILKEVTTLKNALRSGEANLEFAVQNVCRMIKQIATPR